MWQQTSHTEGGTVHNRTYAQVKLYADYQLGRPQRVEQQGRVN
jgi:hypothetical protein